MKLFVWNDVYSDHAPGMAWAVAEDSDRARELIIASASYVSEGLAYPPKVYDLTEEAAGVCYGGG